MKVQSVFFLMGKKALSLSSAQAPRKPRSKKEPPSIQWSNEESLSSAAGPGPASSIQGSNLLSIAQEPTQNPSHDITFKSHETPLKKCESESQRDAMIKDGMRVDSPKTLLALWKASPRCPDMFSYITWASPVLKDVPAP